MVIDMTKSLMKPTNILLILKKYDENNITTIRQNYDARYAYKRQNLNAIVDNVVRV